MIVKNLRMTIFLTLVTVFGYITISNAQISEVSVCPDGKSIVVTYQKNHSSFIFEIDMATGKATRLTSATLGEELSPAFSTDGKLIVYSYYVPKKISQRIIVMNRDNSNQHSLAESAGSANLYATFALDGKTIYFVRSEPPPLGHAWDIYSVDIDGKNVQRLTHKLFYQVSKPSLSPDGKNMAIVTVDANAHWQLEIYALEHPENPIHSLQPHVPKEVSQGPLIDYPNYLPDGRSIIFMAASNGKHGFDYDIYSLTLDTGKLEKLTNGIGYAASLSVFPDGKAAIFTKWRKNWLGTPVSNELYLLDLQTHKFTPFKVTGLN